MTYHPPQTGFSHLEGVLLSSYGTSWGQGAGSGFGGYAYNVGWRNRHLFGGFNNNTRSGNKMPDIAHTTITTSGSGAAQSGMCLFEQGANEWAYIEQPSSYPAVAEIFRDALYAALWITRCDPQNRPAVTFTGTWATVTDTNAFDGSVRQTTTQNDNCGFQIDANSFAVVILNTVLSTTLGTTTAAATGGAAYSVTVDSTVTATGNTSRGCGYGPTFTTCPLALIITPPQDGNPHNVSIKKTDAGSGPLIFDAHLLPLGGTNGIPTQVIVKSVGTTGHATAAATLNGHIDTVVASMPSDGTIVVVDPTPYWDAASMTYQLDGLNLHPNQKGHRAIERAINDTVRHIGFRSPGLNTS